MKREKLSRSSRIKRQTEINLVLRKGKRARIGALTLFFLPSDEQKFGVLVGRKLGKAHTRNLHKRWAREAYRRNKDKFEPTGRIIVSFKEKAESYFDVERNIIEAFKIASTGGSRRS